MARLTKPHVSKMLFFAFASLVLATLTSHAALTDADYARHVQDLNKKLDRKGMTVLVQRPFVVIGNEDAATVRLRAERTVKWAADKLKQDYFKNDPDEIVDIWLLKDDATYRKWARDICGFEASTPFGFYSDTNRALIMNISTGGGTLVHEIVHAFMRANFPDCPAWFNEGLGSLYEQSGEKDGHIIGYTNWRLAGLQEAIKNKKTIPFKDLTGLDTGEFYEDNRGAHYAQARYLCYYLQEKGLLVKFFHEFLAHRKGDPTGYETLQRVLNEKDMEAFRKRWEAFVMRLTFP